MTHFILLFAVTLFLSSLFINGWYNITRGQWVIDHTGKKEWTGKIFSFWGKLLQWHTVEYPNYSGNEFLKQFDKVKDFFQNPNAEILDFGVNAVLIRKLDTKKFSLFFAHALRNGVLVNAETAKDEKGNEDNTKMLITIFKEVKHYKIPNIIRAPFGECLSCMSSIFGSLLWLFWHGLFLKHNNFFAVMPTISKVGLWIMFCIILAYLNEFIFSINSKLQRQ